jgi:hypothetical protein
LTSEERLKEIGLLRNDSEKIGLRQKLQKKGITQLTIQIPFHVKNLAGLNERYNYNKSLLYFYEKYSPLYNDTIVAKINHYLLKMKEISQNNNSELIVLGVPGQIEVSVPKDISYFPKSVDLNDSAKFDLDRPLQIFNNLCLNNDIAYLNSKDVLKNYPVQPLYFEESWHWNTMGHEVIAGYLFEFLKVKIDF